VKVLRDEEWKESNRLILKDRKVYILKNEKLRTKVIRLYHDTPIEGHKEQ